MESKEMVELADRVSRKRATGTAVAAGAFLLIQLIARPFFSSMGSVDARAADVWMWSANAIALLIGLATGGRLAQRREVRALVNDEVSRQHHKTAMMIGYWVAMVTAMALYFIPAARDLNARETVYLIVTPSAGIPLLVFSWLEFRSLRNG
jgi:MFS family permease